MRARAERRDALVRMVHEHGELRAVTPRELVHAREQRFGDAPALLPQLGGGGDVALGVRLADESDVGELARELEGARMVGDLGAEAVAGLHLALEARRPGEGFADARRAAGV